MLDDAIDLLTEQMIKDTFEDKKNNKEVIYHLTKADLYSFCIKLIKTIKKSEVIE